MLPARPAPPNPSLPPNLAPESPASESLGTALTGQEMYQRIFANIEKVVKGQSGAIRKLLAAFVSGGHVLLEDAPGTGKTTLAKALAFSVDVAFKRVQFTPDLLPSDILGLSILDPAKGTFHFHAGPIFANILLADEVNRASPRTQSALLEAMAEAQVSIDGQTRKLADPFFVIATQNPVESRGTYPLPEAQMDRFALQFRLGYLSAEDEVAMLTDQLQVHPIEALQPCLSQAELLNLKHQVKQVRVSPEVKRYAVDLIHATRQAESVVLGASPRATIALIRLAQALALFDGLAFVTPEQIRELAVPVIAHRLLLEPQAKFTGQTAESIVSELVQALPVPA